jgi:uncharacterized protein Yka (UPF0111/DUF47 family)
MSMAGGAITIEILKDIRHEIRNGFQKTGQELQKTNEELQETNQRLDVVETTLLDLAEQQRFVVRYTRAIAERDQRLEGRVGALETRVDKLESK